MTMLFWGWLLISLQHIYYRRHHRNREVEMDWENKLTNKEREVTDLVSRGYNNNQISKKLNNSEGTVKTHLRNIYLKTGVQDRTNLAIRVLKSGAFK